MTYQYFFDVGVPLLWVGFLAWWCGRLFVRQTVLLQDQLARLAAALERGNKHLQEINEHLSDISNWPPTGKPKAP